MLYDGQTVFSKLWATGCTLSVTFEELDLLKKMDEMLLLKCTLGIPKVLNETFFYINEIIPFFVCIIIFGIFITLRNTVDA